MLTSGLKGVNFV